MVLPIDNPRESAMAIRETIAAEVRAALGRDGRKPAALARATGISTSALSRKLKAQAPFWTEELVQIALALNADRKTAARLGLAAAADNVRHIGAQHDPQL